MLFSLMMVLLFMAVLSLLMAMVCKERTLFSPACFHKGATFSQARVILSTAFLFALCDTRATTNQRVYLFVCRQHLCLQCMTLEQTLTNVFTCLCVRRRQRPGQPAVPPQLGLDLPGKRLPLRQRDGGAASSGPQASWIPWRDLLCL